ncbi:MAG: tetratricopeptide repeat protein [bacterium]|nr:tetratricopeptide repeat protein [bacterium]
MIPGALSSLHDIGERYHVLLQLGSGGMGVVYHARDRLSQIPVALKRVHLRADADNPISEYLRVSLTREFQTLASLRHPNIISVLDYGFDAEKQPFFTMDLLENPLTVLEAGRGKALREKIRLLIDALQALVYLHRRGIVHRDLKPGNILVSSGEVKVLDFGLAMERRAEGEIVGTIAYMAPEVLSGLPHTPASDLFAVGVLAYELLTGKYPFAPGSQQVTPFSRFNTPEPETAALDQIDNEWHTQGDLPLDDFAAPTRFAEHSTLLLPKDLSTVPSFSAHPFTMPPTPADVSPPAPLAAPTLSAIVRKLLAWKTSDRYQHARDVIRDLAAAVNLPLPPESPAARESFLQAARFVGREAEMAALSTALDAALDGRGSAMLIRGESGVGKSRLLDELRIQALVKGAVAVRGQAEASSAPYQVWREPLRRMVLNVELDDADAGILRTVVPDIADLLGRPIPDAPPIESGQAEHRLIGLIASVLHRQRRPLVIILEDVHRMRADSLGVLQKLRDVCGGLPVLILASHNDDEASDVLNDLADMATITLKRLTDAEMTHLSESILGETARKPEVIEVLQRETEGNAFFLVEVIRALAEEAGGLDNIGTRSLPRHVFTGGVERVIKRRLDRVSAGALPLLRTAAVLGREIDRRLLAAALEAVQPGTDLEAWLYECTEAAVLEIREQHWQFAHEKLRDGLIREMLPGEYELAHRTAAQAIATTYPGEPRYAAALAAHWTAAGEPMRAQPHWLNAGEYAYLIGDNRSAVGHYRTYLGYAQTMSRVDSTGRVDSADDDGGDGLNDAQIHIRLARSVLLLGQYAEAEQLLKAALEIANAQGASGLAAEATCELGRSALLQGEYPLARGYLSEALRLFRSASDMYGVARARLYLGEIALYEADDDEAADHLTASVIVARSLGDVKGTANALNPLAELMMRQGKLKEAGTYLEEALAINKQLGNRGNIAGTLMHLGMMAWFKGEGEEAMRRFTDAMALFREAGLLVGYAAALNNLGYIALLSMRLDDAQARFEESLGISRTIHDQWGAANTLANLGGVHLEQQRYADAFRRMAEAMEQAEQIGATPLQIEILSKVARYKLETGDAPAAARLVGFVNAHEAASPDVKESAAALHSGISEQLGASEAETHRAAGAALTLPDALRLFTL